MEWDAIQTVDDYLQWLSGVRKSPYRRSLEQARQQISAIDPQVTAVRSGTTFKYLDDDSGRGMFLVPFLGQKILIGCPGFKMVEAQTQREPSVYRQVILLHYLATVDDAYVPIGFVNFGSLPHGRPYEHSLQKGALDPLARAFADNPAHFRMVARALKGRPLEMEDDESVAFSFWPLPHLPMGVAFWPGDDEFPARAQLLVDLNTEKWLPIYDAAIVGRLLCQTLIRLKPKDGRAVELSEAAARGDGALYGAPPEH